MKKTSPPGKLRQFSFIYVWTSVQHCILHHADDILVFLSEQMGLDWFVCQMCSEKRDCSEAITEFPETALVQQASVYLRPRLRHHAAVSLKRGMHSLHSTGWVSGVLGSEALAGGAWLAALPCLVALPAAPFFAVLADSRGRKTGALCICLSFILSWSLAAWCGARGIWAARVAAGVGAAGAFALAPLYVICWLDGSDFREDLTDAIEQQEVMIRTEPSRRDSDALTPMLMRSRIRHRRSRRALISCCLLLTAAAGSGAGAVNSFGIAVLTLCLTILGIYCDPRLNMYSWYTHQLWPYKKSITNREKNNDNLTSINMISETLMYSNLNDTDENSKPFYRVTEKNNSIDEGYVQVVQNATEEVKDKSIWPTVILLSMLVFLYNIGLGSVPYVLISELFSPRIRTLASSLLISWMWLSSFFTLRYFGTLATAIGLHGTFYFGASITFLISWYIYLIIPETRGKNQKQIDELLDGPLFVHVKKRRKVNQT
ncbi:hypothetical protein MSG28_013831 [Choristoneura fumiferana]|uniref:Uncharacterized protein n=1 Tax=Choristoneura fumiferana TaxID=7141 RepID=A0ACC0K9L7_CHOFU|nr:hypothetical protein MSG28_013831 [Choristoneura fumiferana]